MTNQMTTKTISKWTLAILTGAVMWMAGSAALGVADGEAHAAVLASDIVTTTSDDDPGNTWPTPPGPGNTWPGVNQVDGKTWP